MLLLILFAPSSRFSPVFLFTLVSRTCLLEGPELAGGHYGGYSVGFSRLSKAYERVCPPRVKELPREQVHLLSRFSLYPFSFLTAPRIAANPPYAPSGSYLRVLLIFSYYRRGHVGMFHTHTYTHIHIFANPAHTYTEYGPSRGSPDSLPRIQRRSLCFSQVLQYVSTLLQRRKRSRRDAKVTGNLSRGSKDAR